MARDIFIGDVHGCLVELERLLDRVGYDPASDRLAFVGDLVDRGPNSVGVVRLVRALAARHDVVCVRGNHEHKYVRFRARLEAGPKGVQMTGVRRAIYETFDAADLDWMGELPAYARVGDYLVVHGGVDRRHRVEADLQRRRYQDRLWRLRTIDPETLQMRGEGIPWASRYDGRLGPVVYGHEPLDEVRVDAHAVGLDTSCCFGRKLTAMIIEADVRRFASVPAERAYAARSPRRG